MMEWGWAGGRADGREKPVMAQEPGGGERKSERATAVRSPVPGSGKKAARKSSSLTGPPPIFSHCSGSRVSPRAPATFVVAATPERRRRHVLTLQR